jgi:hypothetical protein
VSGTEYRIKTLGLAHPETWSWDFIVPEEWELVSVLSNLGQLPSSRTSGWDNVTVLLRARASP